MGPAGEEDTGRQQDGLRAKALSTRARTGGIRVFNLEAPILERVDVIQLRPCYVKRAFGIDNHFDPAALDQKVAVGRLILQIHFVLEARATAANHRHAQNAARTTLLGQQRAHFFSGAGGKLNQALISSAKSRRAGRLVGIWCNHSRLGQCNERWLVRQSVNPDECATYCGMAFADKDAQVRFLQIMTDRGRALIKRNLSFVGLGRLGVKPESPFFQARLVRRTWEQSSVSDWDNLSPVRPDISLASDTPFAIKT